MKRIRKYAIVAVQEEKPNPYVERDVVEILVIEENDNAFYLNRYTSDGKFVTDTWHQSINEAEEQSKHDYPNFILHWIEMEGTKDDIQEVIETYNLLKEMKITENKNVVRIGKFEVQGFIDFQKCSICNSLRIYHEKYDRIFCPKCNLWLESRCGDPNCEFCVNAPEKPLPRL